jgi:hypothetical protein
MSRGQCCIVSGYVYGDTQKLKVLLRVEVESGGTLLVAQWLRHYTTDRKVAGSIPDGVIEIFH